MTDGIGKGVTNQLGSLGKGIAKSVVSIPAQIAGFETPLQETPTKAKAHRPPPPQQQQNKEPQEEINLEAIRQRDEAEKQRQLAEARRMLEQFTKPDQRPESTLKEKLEMEELEKQKKEIEEERKKAKQVLQQPVAKAKRGNLFGKRVKQQKAFGSEQSKNAVHQ